MNLAARDNAFSAKLWTAYPGLHQHQLDYPGLTGAQHAFKQINAFGKL